MRGRFGCPKDDSVIRICITLALLALALPARAELILPQTQDDIRQLSTKADSGPCVKCGVITDVRSERRQPTAGQTTAAPPASGIGNNVATTPLIGSGSAVKDARNAKKPVTVYKMTVRFDDGTYAFFEQDDQPAVSKGDRVEVIDGRVAPRAER
jgi:hypothetical protein